MFDSWCSFRSTYFVASRFIEAVSCQGTDLEIVILTILVHINNTN